jgi:hypothetical protein
VLGTKLRAFSSTELNPQPLVIFQIGACVVSSGADLD